MWSVRLDFAEPAFPFRPRSVTASPNAHTTSPCSALPVVTVAGDAPFADTVTAAPAREVQVRAYQGATGGADLVCR